MSFVTVKKPIAATIVLFKLLLDPAFFTSAVFFAYSILWSNIGPIVVFSTSSFVTRDHLIVDEL